MRTAIKPLIIACVLALLPACNVVRWQQQRLENALHRANLVQATRTVGDAQLAYWDGGKTGATHRPVLLIHGFGGSAVWTWTPQAVDLAQDRRVLLPDLIWFGGSQSSDTDSSLDRQVAAIDGLLTSLGLAQVDVVGISYGGLVAHELASAHPERVGKLVLVDTPGRLFTLDDRAALHARFATEDFGTVLLPTDADGVARLMNLAYAHPPWAPRFALEQALDVMFKGNRAQQARLLESLWAELSAGTVRTGEVNAPTLIVWGRDDPLFPLVMGQRLAASLNAKLVIIEGARHFPNAEHPEEFNRIVRAFLDGPR